MTDFYSVLRRSIESRDLHSAEERRQVYDQARKAMIRKLWSNDPPLAEDEIASRIGFFDAAVERIEGDLEPPDATGPTALAVAEPPKPVATVYEGYDEEADYTPAVGSRAGSARRRHETETEERSAARAEPRPAPESPPPASAARQSRRELPQRQPEPEPEPAAVEEAAIAEDTEPLPALFRQRESLIERARPAPAERLWRDDPSDVGFDGGDDFAEPGEEDDDAGRRQAPGERDMVRLLAVVIACLAIFLVGFAVYIFYPRSSGPAVADNAGKEVSQVVSDAATAAEIPKRAIDVAQSFDVFDGRDPQVFFSTPDNPVRFDKDKEGGFTRVSSSADAPGARAVIGPGLAERLAGRTIRVTMVARSSREGGADNLRFAYQSGVAISHWQVAKVTPTYGEIGLIWRLPAQRTNAKGDALLIEPGIPGDGTGVDIKSIRIDLIVRS